MEKAWCLWLLLLITDISSQQNTEHTIICKYSTNGDGVTNASVIGEDLLTPMVGVDQIMCSATLPEGDRLVCHAIIKIINETETEVSGQGCLVYTQNTLSVCKSESACMFQYRAEAKAGFCCCLEDNCNDKHTMLPADVFIEEEVERPDHKQTIIIFCCAFAGLIFLGVISIIVFYQYRKKALDKRANQLKIEQYNYDMRMYNEEPPVVNYDDLKLEQCLHRGRFGEVYKAKLNDSDVCVKYFHPQQRTLFYNEKDIYSVLDAIDQTVVKCIAYDERSHPDGTIQYIVIMEYVPLGSLASYLKTRTISWTDLCSLGQTIAAGVGYLHQETYINEVHKHAIVHRDINSRNILIRGDMTCVIADMGFSMKIRGSKVIKNGVEEHAEDGSLRDVGTVRYMAPEILDCAVNLRDCESSLKQIDVYAMSLVLWELVTRCRDILIEKSSAEPKRFMLPFEEELGTHPSFENMRVHVAKNHRRPEFPINIRDNEATRLLRETIEECWDNDAEARLTAFCIHERFKDMVSLMDHKTLPTMSINDTTKGKFTSNDALHADLMDAVEAIPLLVGETPASETHSTGTVMTSLASPAESILYKPDVNVEMAQSRALNPHQGRNVVADRNTHRTSLEELAVHDNTLISAEEARIRQNAEEERQRRQWEDSQSGNTETNRQAPVTRPPTRSVQLDIHNEVRDAFPACQRIKENNLNARRHNSQQHLNESSTSSNGGSHLGMPLPTTFTRPNRPKSLNLNIKPEDS